MGVYKRPKHKKPGQKQYWYIRFYEDSGKRNSSGKKIYINHSWSVGEVGKVSKKEAERVYLQQKAKYSNKKIKASASMSIADLGNIVIDHKRKVENIDTSQRYISVLKTFCGLIGRDTLIENIEAYHVDIYKKERLKHVSPSTVNRELNCIQGTFKLAIKWGEYDKLNPVNVAGKLKVVSKHEDQPLNDQEIELLLTRLPEPVRSMFLFGLNTGMRIAEIRNLKWINIQDVNNDKFVVLHGSDTKNSKPRPIPLNQDAISVLKANNNKSKHVFLNSNGVKYASNNTFNSLLAKACKSAGVRKVSSHIMKKTFINRLIENGVDPLAVRKITGNYSEQAFNKHYVRQNKLLIEAVKNTNYNYGRNVVAKDDSIESDTA